VISFDLLTCSESWSRHFSMVGAVAARHADGLCEVHAHPQCFIVLSLSRFHAESNIKND
jgi:hypothetical protein